MSQEKKRVFWPSLILLGLALLSIAVVSARMIETALSKSKPKSHVSQTARLPEFKQRIRIWVHGDDLRPKQIHAWPGKALVTIENETTADVSIQVERVLPSRTLPIGTVNLPARSKRLQQELLLVPGEYVFYEASRPAIRGRLIVEPR